ncbi:MAG TPA: glycosyltransferase [Rhodanobacteraceae bacterium]
MSAIEKMRIDRPRTGAPGLPRVVFLARSLQQGGAERQLVALASGLHRRGWPVSVVCFYGGGTFQKELEGAGVPLIDLHKRGRWDIFGFSWRLWRVLRKADADIVHGYLPVANMLTLVVRFARRRTRVIWGVRSSFIDRGRRDWLSRASFRLSCRLARFADSIIANSEAGAAYHAALGYPAARIRVVHNGIDTQRFRFDAVGRDRLRQVWNVSGDSVLIGLVGRVEPMKDHSTFLRMAALLATGDPRWRFVCVGGGKPDFIRATRAEVEQLGLHERVIWAGPQDDMAAVYSALDVVVSTSYGEGFSNVIAEAMACGRPCVVTRVGDSAAIAGDAGIAVPPRDAEALCEAVIRMHERLLAERQALAQSARLRIVEQFGIDHLIEQTETALHALLRGEPLEEEAVAS